ncbi:putative WRKY transcription factor [Quillaja saponaria]|uniref:WRKY transcription factor n=1 Tax=Quillaja saponaria TaxID=32244 RepID=A0AAD7PCQ7_QUISA|nr:putative WRKY transcription factor [Quillaja saponaria]
MLMHASLKEKERERETEMEELMANWSDGYEEDELVKELLDDVSPFILIPEDAMAATHEQATNKLISNVYSGPTITDIENALSVTTTATTITTQKDQFSQEFSRERMSILERGLSKTENKYTLKIKSFGNGLSDDGYKWRKYGQKSIKNSPFPRSYYRCTNPRCSAKKQVERSNEDPDTLIITYEGLHLHFTYPFYLLSQPKQDNPPTKKAKTTISQAQDNEAPKLQAQDHEAPKQKTQEVYEAQDSPLDATSGLMPSTFMDFQQEMGQEGMGSQGLLEDMVPLTIRKPSFSNNSSCSNSSCSSYRSPPTSPPSMCWSPNYSTTYYTIGLNSSTR